MQIVILAREKLLEVFKSLESEIRLAGDDVLIFSDEDMFYSALRSAEKGQVVYAVIDVCTLQGSNFNPYSEVALMANPVPLVVFDEQDLKTGESALLWISRNKAHFAGKIADTVIEGLYSEFYRLQSLLERETNNFACAAGDLMPLLSPEEKRRQERIEAFKANSNLPPSRLKLLDYFLQNEGKKLSEEEITLFLFGEYSKETKNRLYTYLCNLRKACEKRTILSVNIHRPLKEHYMVQVAFPKES